jgi:NTP pyrophosphatase (non-canonical NTP hydrolase)
MKQEQLRQLCRIIEAYGAGVQKDIAIEECSELIQAICKHKRGLGNLENIVDEIADVEIMLNQLKIIFDCFGEVEERIDFKIKRQLERISNNQ